MIDAVGGVQRILLLGGTSELGLAIVRGLLRPGRDVEVILAGRDPEGLATAEAALVGLGARTRTLAFDAGRTAEHPGVVASAWSDGDVDVAAH